MNTSWNVCFLLWTRPVLSLASTTTIFFFSIMLQWVVELLIVHLVEYIVKLIVVTEEILVLPSL